MSDVFACEEGPAQERALLGEVLATVQANELWLQDRNFCTRECLCEIDEREAFFVTRQHQNLPFEVLSPLRSAIRRSTC